MAAVTSGARGAGGLTRLASSLGVVGLAGLMDGLAGRVADWLGLVVK